MHIPPQLRINARRRRLWRDRVAVCWLGSVSLKCIGRGAFSTAYYAGQNRVLKVSDAADCTVPWFANYSKRHFSAHWPRFFRQIRGAKHTATWVERLYPLSPKELEKVSIVDQIMFALDGATIAQLKQFPDVYGVEGILGKCPQRLAVDFGLCLQCGSLAASYATISDKLS